MSKKNDINLLRCQEWSDLALEEDGWPALPYISVPGLCDLAESVHEVQSDSAQAGFAVGYYEICEFFSWVEIDRQPGQAP